MIQNWKQELAFFNVSAFDSELADFPKLHKKLQILLRVGSKVFPIDSQTTNALIHITQHRKLEQVFDDFIEWKHAISKIYLCQFVSHFLMQHFYTLFINYFVVFQIQGNELNGRGQSSNFVS